MESSAAPRSGMPCIATLQSHWYKSRSFIPCNLADLFTRFYTEKCTHSLLSPCSDQLLCVAPCSTAICIFVPYIYHLEIFIENLVSGHHSFSFKLRDNPILVPLKNFLCSYFEFTFENISLQRGCKIDYACRVRGQRSGKAPWRNEIRAGLLEARWPYRQVDGLLKAD